MESVEIVKALRSLGLGRGDIVLLHSSLISLGYVEGGADAVIKAFLDASRSRIWRSRCHSGDVEKTQGRRIQ